MLDAQINPFERMDVRRTMQSVRAGFRSIYAVVAEEYDCKTCGFDESSQSGLDPNCPDCEGTGRMFTFIPHEVKGRVKILDFVQLQGAGAAPPGVELGDAAIYVRPHDKDVFALCELNTSSYVTIEGDSASYRIFSISADGVGREDEVRVLLKKAHVGARATGY